MQKTGEQNVNLQLLDNNNSTSISASPARMEDALLLMQAFNPHTTRNYEVDKNSHSIIHEKDQYISLAGYNFVKSTDPSQNMISGPILVQAQNLPGNVGPYNIINPMVLEQIQGHFKSHNVSTIDEPCRNMSELVQGQVAHVVQTSQGISISQPGNSKNQLQQKQRR